MNLHHPFQLICRRTIIIITTIILFNSCTNRQVISGELPYYTSADFTPKWLHPSNASPIHQIPEFSFTNQDGKTITRKDFDHKITVVDFFFTTCPGICKHLTSALVRVQNAFKTDSTIVLLSHSVTPEKDSVPVLRSYASEFGVISGKWHLVTGNRASIYKLARTAYFADEDMGWKQDSTTFLHTENVMLIDQYHHIRGVYKGTVPLQVADLIRDIRELKKEQ